MRRGGQRLDVLMYGQALIHLVRNPTILAAPLVAALIDILVDQLSGWFTDPLGGATQGLFQMLVQIIYLFAFGVAIIHANNVWRGVRATYDDAWIEARKKAGGILLAALGFQFCVYVAGMVGSMLGSTLQMALQLIAYFFLLLTIPAAAIGGLPGAMAISGSIRAVRANPLPCVLLALVFIVLWIGAPYVIVYFGSGLQPLAFELIVAAIRAIVLGYLAFPFAKLYDDTAFRGLW